MTIEIPLSIRGKNAGLYTAIVDDCDADLAELRWNVSIGYATCYARRNHRDFDFYVQEYMHRVILEDMLERKLNDDEAVQHINWNGLDNRRCNLRLITRAQTSNHESNGG